VDFGAFVDLGIKETALVHISELSDRFIKDPLDAVKVGDVLEFRIIGLDQDRHRISLSRKASVQGGAAGTATGAVSGERISGPAGTGTGGSGGKRAVAVKKAGGPFPPKTPAVQGGAGRPGGVADRRDDDGTMYNPFADVFRKMREKKQGQV
jgi:uncharacterized protein